MSHFQDPRAERLVAAYGTALAVARFRYPGLPADDHEVIVQDAYLRVLLRLAKGPLQDPVAYLLRVVHNTGGRLLRQRRRSQESLDGVLGEESSPEHAVDRSLAPLTPEEHVIAREDTALVWGVLTKELTRRERLALVRRRAERSAPARIAEELGTTERGYRHVLEDAGRHLAAGVARARIREAGSVAAAPVAQRQLPAPGVAGPVTLSDDGWPSALVVPAPFAGTGTGTGTSTGTSTTATKYAAA